MKQRKKESQGLTHPRWSYRWGRKTIKGIRGELAGIIASTLMLFIVFIYLSSNNKDWSVSIETVKNKYSPRTSRYYIELESDKNKSITYEEYKDTEINDKIYVVKNKSGKILKTYVAKKYKYVGNNLNK